MNCLQVKKWLPVFMILVSTPALPNDKAELSAEEFCAHPMPHWESNHIVDGPPLPKDYEICLFLQRKNMEARKRPSPQATREVFCAATSDPTNPQLEKDCLNTEQRPSMNELDPISRQHGESIIQQIRLQQRTASAIPPVAAGKEESIKEVLCRIPLNHAFNASLTLDQERTRARQDFDNCLADKNIDKQLGH